MIYLGQEILSKLTNGSLDENFKYYINKPLTLSRSDGNPFLEDSFRNLIKYQKMIENENFIKRQYVLNDIVKHLLNNDMLPALCFIFSRKNVQIAAKEINFSFWLFSRRIYFKHVRS